MYTYPCRGDVYPAIIYSQYICICITVYETVYSSNLQIKKKRINDFSRVPGTFEPHGKPPASKNNRGGGKFRGRRGQGGRGGGQGNRGDRGGQGGRGGGGRGKQSAKAES